MSDEYKPYEEVKGLAEVAGAVDSLRDILATIKDLEASRDELKGQIRTALDVAKVKGAQFGQVKVVLAAGRTMSQLDVDKLQKNGVSLSVIKASTVTSTGEPSVRLFTQEVA